MATVRPGRANCSVLGAGWIDNIEATAARKARYRCPQCTSTDFKHRSKKAARVPTQPHADAGATIGPAMTADYMAARTMAAGGDGPGDNP